MSMNEAALLKLRARAQALEATLAEQKTMFDNGEVQQADYLKLRAHLDSQRREILMTVQKEVSGADPVVDGVIAEALDGQADPKEAAAKLKKVAEEKGLGTKILDAIDRNRGTIITWAIDIALAIGKRAGMA